MSDNKPDIYVLGSRPLKDRPLMRAWGELFKNNAAGIQVVAGVFLGLTMLGSAGWAITNLVGTNAEIAEAKWEPATAEVIALHHTPSHFRSKQPGEIYPGPIVNVPEEFSADFKVDKTNQIVNQTIPEHTYRDLVQSTHSGQTYQAHFKAWRNRRNVMSVVDMPLTPTLDPSPPRNRGMR